MLHEANQIEDNAFGRDRYSRDGESMGLKEWWKGLWSPEIEKEEPTFDDVEAETEKELEERYSDSMAEDLASALEDLDDEEETTPEVVEAVDVSPQIDIGDASADDLLEEEELVSHYDVDVADEIDVEKADSHFISAQIEGDISVAVEEEE
ncbi:MAG: hypothetical protein QF707_00825 [Candidatus Poseidoniaceae archaeon]|jgi:hypothetical protein|nr:hypothetical protein [Candidatus Poseidoniaceae archaeon]MDP7203856.1 hypothetical protein [Candidatus Poseidoniaceae archaeon]